jgi:thioredoxin reductase
VTTGLVDHLPEVPGLAERWGRDVLHCPFCHGREVAGGAVGILATTPAAMHQALLWRSWTDDVTLLRHPTLELTDEQAEQLGARGIAVVNGEVSELDVTDDALSGARLADGRVVPLQALVVFAPVAARDDVLTDLGLQATDVEVNGMVMGTRVPAGPAGATDVPGVRVAGSLVDPMSQVIAAAAAGLMAAAATVGDLVAEETAAAVEQHRARQQQRREGPA